MTPEVIATGDPAKDRANILAGMAQAVKTGDTLVLRRTGPAFKLTAPLVVLPPGNETAFKLDVKGVSPQQWPLIEYVGPAGSKCLTLTGMKASAWDGVTVRVLSAQSTGYALTTKGPVQSTSGNTFSRCDVATFAAGSKGWEVGPDGPGGSDLCNNVWQACTVAGGPSQNQGGGGWLVHGGNTLNLAWYDCTGNYQADYVWQLWGTASWTPGDAGGAGSSLFNCGGSACPGLVKVASGFEFSVFGGRSEAMSQAVFWSGPGSAVGSFTVYNHLARGCKAHSRQDGATPVVQR